MVTEDPKVRRYLSALRGETERLLTTLPEGVMGSAAIRDNHVYADIEGPRLGVFTLVLGSEAPEIVYDGWYIQLDLIGEGMNAQIEYAQQSLDYIVEFLLSDRVPVERKSHIFKRPYLSIPMGDADEWRMKQFR